MDSKLRTGQMTVGQARDFFVTEGCQACAVGEVKTRRGTAASTCLDARLGKFAILKLRAEVEKQQGAGFDLCKFHEGFMQHGLAPVRVWRREMLHGDAPVS